MSTGDAFAAGDKVVLRRGLKPDTCLDSPGEIGVVKEISERKKQFTNGKKPLATPFRVEAFDGKTKWYAASDIRMFRGQPPTKQALLSAAFRGDIDGVGKCVFAGVDISSTDVNGNTALHFAARGGHEAAVQILLEHGVEVDAVNAQRQSALHLAANKPVIATLLAKGADPSLTAVITTGKVAEGQPAAAGEGIVQHGTEDCGAIGATTEVSAADLLRMRCSTDHISPSPRVRGKGSGGAGGSNLGSSSISLRSSVSSSAGSLYGNRSPSRTGFSSYVGRRNRSSASSSIHSLRFSVGSQQHEEDLGSFVEAGWTNQEAHKSAVWMQVMIQQPLTYAMEDATHWAQCHIHTLEEAAKLEAEPEPEEPEKFFLVIAKKDDDDPPNPGGPLDEGTVKGLLTEFPSLEGVQEVALKDGSAFKATFTDEKDASRAVAESGWVKITCWSKPEDEGEDDIEDCESGLSFVLLPRLVDRYCASLIRSAARS